MKKYLSSQIFNNVIFFSETDSVIYLQGFFSETDELIFEIINDGDYHQVLKNGWQWKAKIVKFVSQKIMPK